MKPSGKLGVSVAVVGCGYWGPNLVRNFARVQNGQLVALCDLNEVRLKHLKSVCPSAEATKDYQALLASADLDAVVLATPVRQHFPMAMAALEAGKHVYVEKPLCLQSSQARELIDVAESRHLVLMVGHLLEYHPAIQYLQNLIARGGLGEVYYIYSQRLNLGQVRSDENALWSLAPHDISVANFLFGDRPESVTATGQAFLQSDVHDVVFLTLRYPRGRLAHVQVSWLDPHKTRQLTVVGSQRMAVFNDMDPSEKVRLYDKGVYWDDSSHPGPELGIRLRFGDVQIPWLEATEPLLLECQHFIDCVRNHTRPRSDGWDGLRVIEVLEAADESLRQGGMPVRLSQEDSAHTSTQAPLTGPHQKPVPVSAEVSAPV
jgi:predicted dehydrogenase